MRQIKKLMRKTRHNTNNEMNKKNYKGIDIHKKNKEINNT